MRVFDVVFGGKVVKSGTLAECRAFVLRKKKNRTLCKLVPRS